MTYIFGGTVRTDRRGLLNQRARYFLRDETGEHVERGRSVKTAASCMCDKKFLLGAGNGHVGETAFFLYLFVAGVNTLHGRENAFLHAGKENDREFQSLCAVDGHQYDRVRIFVVFIHIADKRHFLQKSEQSRRFAAHGQAALVFHSRADIFADRVNAVFLGLSCGKQHFFVSRFRINARQKFGRQGVGVG